MKYIQNSLPSIHRITQLPGYDIDIELLDVTKVNIGG
jgi:hypothetical protein